MKVEDKFDPNDNSGYSIEWGEATWTENKDVKERSIRNRYPNKTGGFNIRGSAEIPWEDFKLMIEQSIIKKHFTIDELNKITKVISERLEK